MSLTLKFVWSVRRVGGEGNPVLARLSGLNIRWDRGIRCLVGDRRRAEPGSGEIRRTRIRSASGAVAGSVGLLFRSYPRGAGRSGPAPRERVCVRRGAPWRRPFREVTNGRNRF
jgi:hypothetical protein